MHEPHPNRNAPHQLVGVLRPAVAIAAIAVIVTAAITVPASADEGATCDDAIETSLLLPDPISEYMFYGGAIDEADGLLAVGAWSIGGGVYLYDLSDPFHPQRLSFIPDPDAKDQLLSNFGRPAILDGLLVVGAPLYTGDDGVTEAGAAYVYDISDPTEPVLLRRILPPDPQEIGVFGYAVSGEADTAVIGAAFEVNDAGGYGTAHVVRLAADGSVIETTELPRPGDPPGTSFFGDVSDIQGDVIAIGAHRSNGSEGRVFLYERTEDEGIVLRAAMYEPGSLFPESYYGSAVDLDLPYLAVGARFDDVDGAGWVYRLDDLAAPTRLHRLKPMRARRKQTSVSRSAWTGRSCWSASRGETARRGFSLARPTCSISVEISGRNFTTRHVCSSHPSQAGRSLKISSASMS